MGKLLVYSVFHGNLNFSRVPSELHHQMLRDCYWPLLRKIKENNVQTAVEMSLANTLHCLRTLAHIQNVFGGYSSFTQSKRWSRGTAF